jgi:hypothetical protein
MLTLGGCGDSRLTLTEYAGKIEAEVLEMNQQLNRLQAELEAGPRTLESEQAFLSGRVSLRNDFIAAFDDLRPPESLDEFHDVALGVVRRLTAAEQAMADEGAKAQTIEEIRMLWENSAELRAWRQADADALALCEAAQEEFDTTRERAALEGTVWIPPEMKEVVRVALVCNSEDAR